MRLTKPTLMAFQPLMSDSRDLCGDVIQQLNQSDLAKPRGLDYFPLGDLLTLPQNFGSVLGEREREREREREGERERVCVSGCV